MIAQIGKAPSWIPFAASAAFLVGLAWLVMRWARKTVQKDLDPVNTGKMRPSMALKADVVPPALLKEALAKGLVSAQQLATMSPVERQFLFQQLAPKLAAAPGVPGNAPPPLTSNELPLKPTLVAAPLDVPQLRSTQAIPVIPGKPLDLPPPTPAQVAAFGSPRTPAPNHGSDAFRLHCPCCGTSLRMPAFPPLVAFCESCGAKTAVRTEEQGRLVINTAPPGVTHPPAK
ncbi:MAG: hypothetical protein IT356_08355 [Gemmatimonadaceae bacterium]|nr:hypothetical protein [Gemmatimonadaceae bacterium]